MSDRLMGLETEYCVRCSSPSSFLPRPSKKQVCLAILGAIDRVTHAAPGERDGEPHFQRFVQNGGAFSFEVTPIDSDTGLLESATPECRGASQLLLYQRAQERVIQRALPVARERLASRGFEVDLAVVKNCRDAEGHVYGTQENYEVDIACGWQLFVYRAGVVVLLPFVAALVGALMACGIVLGVLAAIIGLPILLSSQRARAWMDRFTEDSPRSPDDDCASDVPPRLLRICAGIVWVPGLPITLAFLLLLRVTAFRAIRTHAMAFLISRPIVTGAGTLHPDGTFGLSERAESITSTIRTTARQRSKSIFETSNLVKRLYLNDGNIVRAVAAAFSRRQRLHLGLSDSNCAQTAEFLKVGTTALVLDMIETGFLSDAPRVRRPVRALKQVSGDRTLRSYVALSGGASMTALEIQRWYLRRAEAFLRQGAASPGSLEVVKLWRRTLQDLEENQYSLVGRIDWVTKRCLMGDADTLSDTARKKIDIKYHELGSGYFAMLERRGLAAIRLSAHDISDATYLPPEDTPAKERGEFIRLTRGEGPRMPMTW